MKHNAEFERFNNTMRRILKVSHADVKAKLDSERAAKKRKARKPSASGRASLGKG